MATISPSPFSLRPWPTGDKKPKNLAEFIARVNAERDGFRNVTEAKLRDEVKEQEEGRTDVDRAEGESDSEDDVDTDKSKTVVAAREEFLKNIEFAHQSAMLSLDFVSLLLSKETPVQAGITLSPALRDLVGIGTLGASKLKEPSVTEARIQDDLAVATGWRVMGINNMVDSVMAAAERLEKEIELETRYWADVLAVSEEGWAVCPLPQEPHTLGVRFGFPESALDFRNNSIAPLRRNDDGTVHLGIGRVGRGSQRVRITYKKNGAIIDQSPLPGRTPENAPLTARVLEARNTIFHQELWYELNREARTLLSLDVYSDGSTVTWKQNPQAEVLFTLEDLSEPDKTYQRMDRSVYCSCTAHYSFMQFLLFQAHRQNYFKRTSLLLFPPSRMAANQPYTIIRAMVAHLKYFTDTERISHFTGEVVQTLQRAGISTASFTSSVQPPSHSPSQARSNSKRELHLINQLVGRLETNWELHITPEARIYIRNRLTLLPFVGVHFGIGLRPPPPSSENNNAPPPPPEYQLPNMLETSYPPSDPVKDPYPNAKDAIYYLRQATIRAVAQKLANTAAEKLSRDDIGWVETVCGPGITDREERETRIDVSAGDDGHLVLSLDAQWHAAGAKEPASKRWTWRTDGDDAGGESIGDAVVKVMMGTV